MCHDAVDTGAEADSRIVGRGFSRDIKPAFPSGVSTPEGILISKSSSAASLMLRFYSPIGYINSFA
jgi:hypothetical protein